MFRVFATVEGLYEFCTSYLESAYTRTDDGSPYVGGDVSFDILLVCGGGVHVLASPRC